MKGLTMNQNQIEGKCRCVAHVWASVSGYWMGGPLCEGYMIRKGYCPHCGYHLGPDGWARRTAVVPEEPWQVTWRRTTLGQEPLLLDPETDYWIPPDCEGRYYLIPVPQEGVDESLDK